MSHTRNQNEQEPQTPHLDSIRKEELFQVPMGYFESLPDAIMKRIAEDEKPAARILSIFSRRFYWAAASVAASLVIGWFVYEWRSNQSERASAEAPMAEAIDTSSHGASQEVAHQEQAADKKEIINYLMDNGVELSTITEEL